MGYIKCKKCGEEIVGQPHLAKKCPHCGADRPVSNKQAVIMLIVFVLLGLPMLKVLWNMDSQESSPGPSAQKTEEELRKERIAEYFSLWDGSHRTLTRLIKDAMHDPRSYEHVETRYWDMGDYLIVTTTYRGKNAFGGVVKNSMTAKVDLDGRVIEVISQGR